MWAEHKLRHAAELAKLRPNVHRRERTRYQAAGLRLIAGPLPNDAIATKLCIAIAAAGTTCQPVIFEGQKLALQ